MISIVIPIFNEAETLPMLWPRLSTVLSQINQSFEVIFVDDGSTDDSNAVLQGLASQSPIIKILQLSRNFGHQSAISAGLEHCTGEAVIILDGDLQDPPELIPKLLEQWQKGYAVVYAVRSSRAGETWFKKLSAKLYYKLLNQLAGVKMPADAGDFRLLDKKVIVEINKLPENHRYIRGLSHWVGFNSIGVPYERETRLKGATKYPLHKMFRLAWDGITAFSYLPLRLATYLGFLAAGGSVLYALYALWEKFARGNVVQGWTSLILVVLFLGGIQLIILGIIGEYLGRLFEETKHRPRYIVAKKIGFQ